MSTDDQPRGLPRQDLAGKFARPDRTSGLAGRLTRTEPSQPTPEADATGAADVEPDAATSPAPAALDAAPKKEKPTPKKPKPKRQSKPAGEKRTPSEQPQNYPVYVPAAVFAAAKERREAEGTTNTLLVFDAIDALIDPQADDPLEELREHVADSLVGAPKAGSLFSRRPQRTRGSIYTGTNTQLVLRITPANREVLEDLVEQTGARDRGNLVTVALVHYLNLQGE